RVAPKEASQFVPPRRVSDWYVEAINAAMSTGVVWVFWRARSLAVNCSVTSTTKDRPDPVIGLRGRLNKRRISSDWIISIRRLDDYLEWCLPEGFQRTGPPKILESDDGLSIEPSLPEFIRRRVRRKRSSFQCPLYEQPTTKIQFVHVSAQRIMA